MTYKLHFATACVLFLSGCALPALMFEEKNMGWEQVQVELNYETVYANLQRGTTQCFQLRVEDYIDKNAQEAQFRIYWERKFAFGMINIKPANENTSIVDIGFDPRYPYTKKIADSLYVRVEKWANGVYCE